MRFQQILLLFLAGISITSLGITGGAQKSDFEAQAQAGIIAQTPALPPQERAADVPFVPTPQPVVDAMLELAKVNSNDVLYDLGSGDGRIPITAAQKYNVRRAIGIEINPELVRRSQANAQQAGVSDRVQFSQQDLFQTNLSDATVVTLYLLSSVNLKLRPKLLRELKPGTRIVSHNYGMGNWKPDRIVRIQSSTGGEHTLYYWVVPETVPQNL
jgi:precorrin-6B methylase 2